MNSEPAADDTRRDLNQSESEQTASTCHRFPSAPPHLMKRLEELKARRHQLCSRSTSARKLNLKRQIYETVAEHLQSPSDRTLLGVDPTQELAAIAREQTGRRRWGKKAREPEAPKAETKPSDFIDASEAALLARVVPREEANVDYPISEGPVERGLERAVEEGHVDLAIRLSDRVVADEMDDKERKMVAAKEALESRQKKEMKRLEKKRKKHQWTFKSKARWESKCNM